MFIAQNTGDRTWWRVLFLPPVLALTIPFLVFNELLSTSLAASTFVVTNVSDSGPGSLRQAMIDANANPGLDTITFSIGSGHQTIKPLQRLPFLTDPIVIDGRSQPGFSGTPIIEIDSSNLVEGNGLFIDGGDSTVRSLVINGSYFDGIAIGFKGGNRIEGCFIGTDVTGTIARPNGGNGISVPSSNNVIGGTTLEARNVISGNLRVGIDISRPCCTGNSSDISGNVIQGNHVGVNAQGNAAIPNQREGIRMSSVNSGVPVTGNAIGGTAIGAGNVISGNRFDGIDMGGSNLMNNTVQSNFIGTDATGNFAIANEGNGIECTGSNNLIGGSIAGARNIISGNGKSGGDGDGVRLGGAGNIVRGNIIGANGSLTAPIPNFFHGVSINALNSVIGGTAAGEANVIAFNGTVGIVSRATSATGNSFRGNSIFSNGFLNHTSNASIGIDIGDAGPTPNDAGDGDAGANNLQNFPIITEVTPGANSVNVKGTLNSSAATIFDLDFYASSACDPLGFGEGARLIGSAIVQTNGNGDASFDITLPATLPGGQVLTATATDPLGNTSEFSLCSVPSPAAGNINFSPTFSIVSEAAGTATFFLTRTGGSAGSLTVGFSIFPETATPGLDYTETEGTLTFADGETSQMFTIPIKDDSISEAFETAKVILNTSGALDTLGSQSTATLTIEDNDPLPTVSIRDVQVIEGNSGTTDAIFSVTISSPSERQISVVYSTANGSASSGSDYVASTSSLIFSPLETSKHVMITVNGDLENEQEEDFFVNLISATNATRVRSQAKGTILNDDGTIPVLELILEELPSEPIQAAALDSVLFVRDPFPVINEANLLNQGPDRNTRVMVFVRDLPPGVTTPSVSVNLVDPGNKNYNLVAEDVRPLVGCDCVQVIFRLPDDVTLGECFIRIVTPTSSSNSGTIRIRI